MKTPLMVDGQHIADVFIQFIPQSSDHAYLECFNETMELLKSKIRAIVYLNEEELTALQKCNLVSIGWKSAEARRQEEQARYTSKDVYLIDPAKSEILGIHATYFIEDLNDPIEAWINQYSLDWKFRGSISRIFGKPEESIEDLEKVGWTRIEKPKET